MHFTECSPGYSGVGCSIKCFYPLFGENCQKVCSCSPVEFCDYMHGCLKSKYVQEVKRLGGGEDRYS